MNLVEIQGNGTLCYLTADLLARYGVEPRGVLHVGAHHGEEVPIYRALGFDPIVLVEPQPAACEVIRRDHPDAHLVEAAVASSGDRAALFEGSRSTSSGLSVRSVEALAMTEVTVYRADQLQRRWPGCSVLVVDTQGTELDVLQSADLGALDLIIAETDDVGRDAAPHYAVVEYLAGQGWRPVERWRHGWHPYSDVVFVREVPRG